MNVNDMTAQECADWCADQDGWNYEPAKVEGFGATAHYWWRYTIDVAHGGRTYASVHPYPLTIDGAAAALPEGWRLHRLDWCTTDESWVAEAKKELSQGRYAYRQIDAYDSDGRWVAAITDELTARYRLAVACKMAAKEQA
jgi:hypothetical protein